MRMKPSARLLKLLKPPSQVANALDWKKQTKTIATLHIGRHQIGVAIASHPSLEQDVTMLHPVNLDLVTKPNSANLNQRAVAPASIDRLERICHKHNVGSFLVWWPLQKEGRAGACCGKVLHTLESLASESDAVLTPSRPVCLWTGGGGGEETAATREAYVEDEWGRAAVYSRCAENNQTIYLASIESYCFPKGSSETAAETWDSFASEYWPLHHHAEPEKDEEQEGQSIVQVVKRHREQIQHSDAMKTPASLKGFMDAVAA